MPTKRNRKLTPLGRFVVVSSATVASIAVAFVGFCMIMGAIYPPTPAQRAARAVQEAAQVERVPELSEHDKLCAIADKLNEMARNSATMESISCETISGVQQLIPLEDLYYPTKGR